MSYRTSPTLTGPLTFLRRCLLSAYFPEMSMTLTWVIPPLEPVLPRSWVTLALTGYESMLNCFYYDYIFKNNWIKSIYRSYSSAFYSLEQQKAVLTDVKVNVVFGLIGYIRAEISSNKAMPITVVSSIELVLEMCGYLLNGMHFLESVFGSGNNVCFHLRTDIFGLDDGFGLSYLLHD